MAIFGFRRALLFLPMICSLAAHAQLNTMTPDSTEAVGQPITPTDSDLFADNDVAARLQAQLDLFGGPVTDDQKQAMLSSFLQQKQLYTGQFANGLASAGAPAWRSLGPTSAQYETNFVTLQVSDSGRIRTMLQSPVDDDTVYVLTAGGGLWKTTTFTHEHPLWQPKTDALLTTSGGSVAFGKSPNTLYLGLGDPFYYFPTLGGLVTRSLDGGDTWSPLANLPGASYIRDLKVDTSGPVDIVLVATDVGLFRSADAGATFTQVANVPGQGFWSIVQTSAGWLARSGFRIYRANPVIGQLLLSTDKGATWNVTGTGLTNAGRATLAVAVPGDAVVYAFAALPDGTAQRDLFRSNDGGLNWTTLNITGLIPLHANYFQPSMDLMGGQAWYNQLILVDPADSTRSTIYLGGQLSTAKTADGGRTWSLLSSWLPIPFSPYNINLPYVHADCHFATFLRDHKANTVAFGTDGGLFLSPDAGNTWDFSKNYGIVSFYSQTVASSTKNPQTVATGMQDDGTRARLGASDVFNQIVGGDGEGIGWSQANNLYTLASVPNGIYSLTGVQPNTHSQYRRGTYFPTGYFFTPIATPSAAFDPSGSIFFSAVQQGLIATTNGGSNWFITARRGGRLPLSFGFREGWNFIGLNNTSDGIALAGYTGKVAVTLDYQHYKIRQPLCVGTNAPPACVPGFQGYITSPVWAPRNALYVASESPIPGSIRVIRSPDAGATWQAAGNGLPDAPVYSLAVDPRDASGNTVFAGTNIGIYKTSDGGGNWALFGSGLPTTDVHSLWIAEDGSLLRAALNGRGLWEITP